MPFTYGQVLNQARSRHPRFAPLVLDDAAVVRDLRQLVMKLVDEGAKIDNTIFQRAIQYSIDFPGAAFVGVTVVELPAWVSRVHAVQAMYSDGSTAEIDLQRSETRVRNQDERTDLGDWLSPADRKPEAFLEFVGSVWQIRKYITANGSPWDTITDLLVIVDGQEQDYTREDLDAEVPLPERALIPMAEWYAITLAQRADLSDRWIERQTAIAGRETATFAEWLIDFEHSRDDPFDPLLP